MALYKVNVEVETTVSRQRKHKTSKRSFTVEASSEKQAISIVRKKGLTYNSGIRAYKIISVSKYKSK